MKNLKELIEAQEELVKKAKELGLNVSVNIHGADIVEVKSLGLDAKVEITESGVPYGVTHIRPFENDLVRGIVVFSKFNKVKL